jgi:predicted SAM-dependent methyltransferase
MKIVELEAIRSNLLASVKGGILHRGRVRRAIGAALRNRPFQLLGRAETYANVGCGGNILKGYVNIDYSWAKGVVCWDITKGLPLDSDSMMGIFTEHTIEHLEWQDALHTVFPEIHRVLKPGGVLRISVPDAEKVIDDYTRAKGGGETSQKWCMPHHQDLTLRLWEPSTMLSVASMSLTVWGTNFCMTFKLLSTF